MNLHGQARLFEGEVCIVGIGGSNPTPFNTPSEFSESRLLAIGEKAFEEAKEYVALGLSLYKKNIPVILVSHAPPFNTKVDRLRSGRPVGSKAIRSLIEKYRPALVIVGHIHEAKGIGYIDDIPIYNPGMFRLGGYVAVEINQSQLTVHLE
jgi:Icc-related predicted phosphoesterase